MSTTVVPPVDRPLKRELLTLVQPLKQAIVTLRANPFHFLLLQLPELSVDLLQFVVPEEDSNRILIVLFIVLPYFCVATFLSRCLTYVSAVQSGPNGPSFRRTIPLVTARWRKLVPVSLLTGLLLMCGFALFIVPAIYFLAVYLFVPILLIVEPPSPWSSYFFRSKRLVSTALPGTLFAVILMLGLSAFLEFDVGREWLESLLPTGFPSAVTYAMKLTVMMLLGAVCSLWITFYYEKLRNRS